MVEVIFSELAESLARVRSVVAANRVRIARLRERIASEADGAKGDPELTEASVCLEASTDALVRVESGLVFFSRPFLDAPCALFVTNRAGIIVDANDEAARLLRVPRTMLQEKALIGFVARGDCAAFRGFKSAIRQEATTARLRMRARHGGGVFSADVRARASTGGFVVWTVTRADEPAAAHARPEATVTHERVVDEPQTAQ